MAPFEAGGRRIRRCAWGDHIAYQKKNQIWSVGLGESDKPAQLIHTRGRRRLAWSPDGSALSFVDNRGDHNFIGVYTFSVKSLRFLEPGRYRPPPDLVARFGAVRLRPCSTSHGLRAGPRRSAAEPWAIQVADLKRAGPADLAAPGQAALSMR
jgi:hypothetical protein